ncbi:STAS domain-containing protein [Magnetospirillum fulvum]|jgi:anti-anti-sigma factor|uniref:Anti-sigma factor antagonist n=1 Tax=Magnetospirillum fulvum TaxID=1082 RepID=A0A1H6HNY4_MAGFU|nr:STAS domain-containing protein [Magnetospirillum fulvum]SEH35703.1 anti-anti-sigma factor [Magnetospirillum fulvum]
MDFDIEMTATGLRVILRGRLTFTQNDSFRRMLAAVLAAHRSGGGVVLDLGGVDFIDSAGLGLLLHTRDWVRRRSGTVALVGAVGQVDRMLTLARFAELFDSAA